MGPLLSHVFNRYIMIRPTLYFLIYTYYNRRLLNAMHYASLALNMSVGRHLSASLGLAISDSQDTVLASSFSSSYSWRTFPLLHGAADPPQAPRRVDDSTLPLSTRSTTARSRAWCPRWVPLRVNPGRLRRGQPRRVELGTRCCHLHEHARHNAAARAHRPAVTCVVPTSLMRFALDMALKLGLLGRLRGVTHGPCEAPRAPWNMEGPHASFMFLLHCCRSISSSGICVSGRYLVCLEFRCSA
jgi:hypothetical protein